MLRERAAVVCGCVFFRDHELDGTFTITVEPCDSHAALADLRARDVNRYLTRQWPPSPYAIARAKLRAESYTV